MDGHRTAEQPECYLEQNKTIASSQKKSGKQYLVDDDLLC
jgi:hypothetical protein